MTRRLALFAHWDAEARVRPFTLFHLQALRDQLGAEVHFVSNSPLPEAEQARVRPLCQRLVLRENVGFDFAMWQEGLRAVELPAWDEVILTNSSVVGPLRPLGPIFERMAGAGLDFWGMTENAELTPHLQSYFLVLRAGALRAPVLRAFFESVLPYRNKKNVILAYEAGLSPLLAEHGLRGAAAFPPESLPPAWGRDLFVRGTRPWAFRRKKNPTLYYADRLWAAGMPYLKLELLRSQPARARRLGVARLVEGRPELAW